MVWKWRRFGRIVIKNTNSVWLFWLRGFVGYAFPILPFTVL